jgi:tetratricopeptide (TPR) repeat protein
MVLTFASGLILTVLSGCSNRPASFSLALAKIDALGLQAPASAFADAAALAGTSAEKLRLLKRTRLIDSGLAADTAARFAGSAMSPVVGLAALDAFLEAGRFEAAIELFRTILPPKDFPLEFAETFVGARSVGLSPFLSDSDRAWLVTAYDETGWTEFLYEAIFYSLRAGDTGSARFLLHESISKGALIGTQPVIEILWHYGFLDMILALGSEDSSYQALAVYGDSAFLSGHKGLATSVYAELIERYPLHSWKPYAALGRIAEQAAAAQEAGDFPMPLAPPSRPRNPESGYWYAMMRTRFPEDSSVALEYGLWLARQGSRDEAISYLRKTGGAETVAEAAARLALEGMDYLPLAAIDLAARYPDSALAVDSALAALFFSASWNRFLSLNAWREVGVPRAWFWDAASFALAGDFEAALHSLEHSSPMIAGFEVSYTLASYESALGRYKSAASRYMIAAGEAESASVSAKCFVRAGDSLLAAGEPVAAAMAYTAALGVDDFNPEAMAALRRLPAR